LLHLILSYARWGRPAEEWNNLTQIAVRENPARIEEVRSMALTIEQAAMERGAQQGRLELARTWLRQLMEDRFGPLSEVILLRINAQDDVARLNAAARQVYRVQSLDELQI
jgi:hypothetical protein